MASLTGGQADDADSAWAADWGWLAQVDAASLAELAPIDGLVVEWKLLDGEVHTLDIHQMDEALATAAAWRIWNL